MDASITIPSWKWEGGGLGLRTQVGGGERSGVNKLGMRGPLPTTLSCNLQECHGIFWPKLMEFIME